MNTGNINATVKEWVELHAEDMTSWALVKTGSITIAEDLVQDTFYVALTKIHTFRSESAPKTWLFAILNNKIHDYYRRTIAAAADTIETEIDDRFFTPDGSWKRQAVPESDLSDKHLLDDPDFIIILRNCLNSLSHNYRNALQLKYICEYDGNEVCQELHISASNYWQILHRAKLQMRQCLEKKWFSL